MQLLGYFCTERGEHDRAMEWYTKGAETGLPKAMFILAVCLDKGEWAAPDYPAAAGWYRRAAAAGNASAANNLFAMYTLGRGRAGQIMPMHASQSSIS